MELRVKVMFVLIHLLFTGISWHRWERYDLLSGWIYTGNVVYNDTITFAQCAQQCSISTACQSFFYKWSRGECLCTSTIYQYGYAGMSLSSNTDYFINGGKI